MHCSEMVNGLPPAVRGSGHDLLQRLSVESLSGELRELHRQSITQFCLLLDDCLEE